MLLQAYDKTCPPSVHTWTRTYIWFWKSYRAVLRFEVDTDDLDGSARLIVPNAPIVAEIALYAFESVLMLDVVDYKDFIIICSTFHSVRGWSSRFLIISPGMRNGGQQPALIAARGRFAGGSRRVAPKSDFAAQLQLWTKTSVCFWVLESTYFIQCSMLDLKAEWWAPSTCATHKSIGSHSMTEHLAWNTHRTVMNRIP